MPKTELTCAIVIFDVVSCVKLSLIVQMNSDRVEFAFESTGLMMILNY